MGNNMNKTKANSIKITIPQPQKPQVSRSLPINKIEIDEIKKRSHEKLLFSFRFLDKDHDAFNLGETSPGWFITLLEVLREINDLNRAQLVGEYRERYRYHDLDFEGDELPFKFGFSDDFLEQVEPRQFSLCRSRGRVHGFAIGNRFYVVWLDPNHNLYPRANIRYCHCPKLPYEILEDKIKDLEKECAKLKSHCEAQEKDNEALLVALCKAEEANKTSN